MDSNGRSATALPQRSHATSAPPQQAALPFDVGRLKRLHVLRVREREKAGTGR
ncbi:hypothetical protein L7F22_026610, partial [Adiantum nelumboides]|nr:hypothetical protein [Adiantum nelumboides]